ncbi:MAG: NUDIX hydrolase [Propionibacteriaceae bacterium]
MSLHLRATEELTDWIAPDADQAALREQYLAHLSAHTDGWSRNCPGAHLTASALVVDPSGDRVLLTLHRKLGRWLQTGGHLEPKDETLPGAALREAREESGLTALCLSPTPLVLSRHEVPCGTVRPTFHHDVQYLAIAAGDAVPQVSEESVDVRWFTVDALPEVDHSVRELVAAARVRLAD